jgi:glycosyltransferase involved in cell wall biosynthesis
VYRDHSLSVLIPCYNEEEGVRQVLWRMPRVVDEVIVIDNNCTDGTAVVARSMRARVVEQRRRGYGAAYQVGMASATTDLVVTMDGDGSYPPEEIPRLVDTLLDREWDFLSGCRFPLTDGGAMEFTNRVGNWILTVATGVLFARPIRDSQSGMWVFRREALARMCLTSDGMAFSEEIKIEALLAGLRFGEAHIPYGERVGTVKLQKWRDGFDNLAFLARKRFGWGIPAAVRGALYAATEDRRVLDRAA